MDNPLITLDISNTSNITPIEKQIVITHEMGHGLKLSHPFHDNPNYLVLSVMNNFKESRAGYLTYEPTAYDIYFLNEKWG